MAIVDIVDLRKSFQLGDFSVEVLKGITVSFDKGEYTAIMGPSGSGKSTFLNILGCLDTPTSGKYVIGDKDVSMLDDDELSNIRRSNIGFVFQSFNLISELNVIENIEVPLFYQGTSEKKSQERAKMLAEMVGLGHRLKHSPKELSGGEQQRVAIARSLANDPLILLADEPTGNLDSKNGAEILDILDKLHDNGTTIIIVTHDEGVAKRTNRIVRFKDGVIDVIKNGGKERINNNKG